MFRNYCDDLISWCHNSHTAKRAIRVYLGILVHYQVIADDKSSPIYK